MKRKGIISILTVMAVLICAFAIGTLSSMATEDIAIDATNFPDPIFRDYVSGFDTDEDGILSSGERSKVYQIRVKAKGIESLEGIQHFPYLSVIECQENALTELDTSFLNAGQLSWWSSNDQVRSITVSGTTVDMSQYGDISRMKGLTGGTLDGNILTLDVGVTQINYDYQTGYPGFGATVTLIISNASEIGINEINFPDEVFREYITANFDKDESGALSPAEIAGIKSITLSSTGLADLTGIQFFSGLKTLTASTTDISKLDLSQNPLLEDVNVANCKLTSLDLSANFKLNSATVSPQSARIDSAVGVIELASLGDVAKMSNLVGISESGGVYTAVAGNISYDYDVGYQTAKMTVNLTVNETLPGVITVSEDNFPDPIFRAYVESFNTDGVIGLSVAECTAVTAIDVSKEANAADEDKIRSLKGIEFFIELKSLEYNNNAIAELDLAANTKLTSVNSMGNAFTAYVYGDTLDFNDIVSDITKVRFVGEEFPSDGILTVPTDIESIEYIYDTGLTYFAHTATLMLEFVIPIDESTFPDMAFRNYIETTVNTDGIAGLSEEEILAVTSINLYDYGVVSLDGIELFTGLEALNCERNGIETLDLSNNKRLTFLNCSNNNIKTVDLSENTDLMILEMSGNDLTYIDLSANKKLVSIDMGGNMLTYLNLDGLEELESVYAFEQYCFHDFSESLTLDLSSFGNGGFDADKVVSIYNAKIEGDTLTVLDPNVDVRYLYEMADGFKAPFVIMTPKKLISEFDILLDEKVLPKPAAGESTYRDPLALAEVFRQYGLRLTGAEWRIDDNGYHELYADLAADVPFNTNGIYYLNLYFEPMPGYEFDENADETSFKLCGEEADSIYDLYGDYMDITFAYGEIDSISTETVAIESFELTLSEADFPAPKMFSSAYRDEAPLYKMTDGQNFSYGGWYDWYDLYYDDYMYVKQYDSSNLFYPDRVYELSVYLIANEGYHFDEENLDNYKLNGNSPSYCYYYEDIGMLEIFYTYPPTDDYDPMPMPPAPITSLDMTASPELIPIPFAGLGTYIDILEVGRCLEGDGYFISDMRWCTKDGLEIASAANPYITFDENTDVLLSIELFLNNYTSYFSEAYVYQYKLNGKAPFDYEISSNVMNEVVVLYYELGNTGTYHDHDFSAWVTDETSHKLTCSVCGTVDAESVGKHDGGAATCNKLASCKLCGIAYGEYDLTKHVFDMNVGTKDMHWTECSVCAAEKPDSRAAHSFGDDGSCDVCEWMKAPAPTTPVDPPAEEPPTEEPPTEEPPTEERGGLPSAAVVGITAGSVIALEAGAFAIFWFLIKKKRFADIGSIFK